MFVRRSPFDQEFAPPYRFKSAKYHNFSRIFGHLSEISLFAGGASLFPPFGKDCKFLAQALANTRKRSFTFGLLFTTMRPT